MTGVQTCALTISITKPFHSTRIKPFHSIPFPPELNHFIQFYLVPKPNTPLAWKTFLLKKPATAMGCGGTCRTMPPVLGKDSASLRCRGQSVLEQNSSSLTSYGDPVQARIEPSTRTTEQSRDASSHLTTRPHPFLPSSPSLLESRVRAVWSLNRFPAPDFLASVSGSASIRP